MSDNPTQSNAVIWWPWQRSVRTIVSAIIVLVPILNGLLLSVQDYLGTLDVATIPPVVFVWLNGAIVVVSGLMGLLARVMAIPSVNAWLTKIGLGSAPRSAGVDGSPDGTGA